MSELDGLDITVNTDSPKFIRQLPSYKLKSINIIKRHQKHIDWENIKNRTQVPLKTCYLIFAKQ